MSKTVLIFSTALALGAASANATEPKTAPESASAATIAAQAVTADAYVTNAALSDMYEIESSRLATQKARSAGVKTFAQQMITDHSATTAKLKATVASAGLQLAPPAQLDPRRQSMLDTLKGLSGADFDRAYLEQQTAAHQEALALHSGFAKQGDNAALKRFAAETTPKIQHHFDMVKRLHGAGAMSH